MLDLQAQLATWLKDHVDPISRAVVRDVAHVLEMVDSDGARKVSQQMFQDAAAKGDPQALAHLACVAFHAGQRPQARTLYEAAAAGGDALAQNNLAVMLLEGLGQGKVEPSSGGTSVQKDHRRARQLLAKSASQGSATAQTNLACAQYMGHGSDEREVVGACEWFARAAQQGDPIAECNLGLLLLRGEGMPKDDVQARMWLQRAAAHHTIVSLKRDTLRSSSVGQAQGRRRFPSQPKEESTRDGDYLCRGGLVPLSNALLLDWARADELERSTAKAEKEKETLAGEQGERQDEPPEEPGMSVRSVGADRWASRWGDGLGPRGSDDADAFEEWVGELQALRRHDAVITAQATLGYLCASGIGGPQNLSVARAWLGKAAAAGHPSAQARHAAMCYDGLGGERDPKAARQGFAKAAAAGVASAQTQLAHMCLQGEGGHVDVTRARQSLLDSAEAGDTSAMVRYAQMLRHGDGGEIDLKGARRWFGRAAALGDPVGQCNLAFMLQQGDGGSQMLERARFWYARSAVQPGDHNAAAATLLANMCLAGRGGPLDAKAARRWYHRAAAAGEPEAQRLLGVMLFNGMGGRPDRAAGREWLAKSSAVGAASQYWKVGDSATSTWQSSVTLGPHTCFPRFATARQDENANGNMQGVADDETIGTHLYTA